MLINYVKILTFYIYQIKKQNDDKNIFYKIKKNNQEKIIIIYDIVIFFNDEKRKLIDIYIKIYKFNYNK